MLKNIDFLGLPLITGDFSELANWLISVVQSETRPSAVVSHINANNYYLLSRDPKLYHKMKDNAYLLFDGIAMKLAAFWLFHRWLPDLNGTDIFPLFMEQLANKSVSIYFLGADELTVERAVQRVRSLWTKANIVGYSSGYFVQADEDRVVQSVNTSGAKVLLIGRGFPLQEEFSLRQRSQLKVSLIWNVGGLFDYLSENKPRAPLLMRQWRLEWLFRLVLEPGRLCSRTFVVGPWLASQILAQQFNTSKEMWKEG